MIIGRDHFVFWWEVSPIVFLYRLYLWSGSGGRRGRGGGREGKRKGRRGHKEGRKETDTGMERDVIYMYVYTSSLTHTCT